MGEKWVRVQKGEVRDSCSDGKNAPKLDCSSVNLLAVRFAVPQFCKRTPLEETG